MNYVVSPTSIIAAAKSRKVTFSVAESCTGGLLSHYLTNIPGISAYFNLGAVTYSNAMKQLVLGVSADTLASFGAVSKETAHEMAEGVRRVSGSSLGVATTGFAGPKTDDDYHPVGTVYIGVSSTMGTQVFHYCFGDVGREAVKEMAAVKALEHLEAALRE